MWEYEKWEPDLININGKSGMTNIKENTSQ